MKMKILADLAGVSPSTVSKAFSGSNEISEATRERIFAIAKELGVYDKFDKNKFAKRIIAVICPTVGRDYYDQILKYMKEQLEANNCMMLVSMSDFAEDKRYELYSYYTAYAKVDGVIVLSHTLGEVNPEALMIPTVLYTKNPVFASDLDTIFMDMRPAILDALDDLKARGHRSIALVRTSVADNRREILANAMAEEGIPLLEEDVYLVSGESENDREEHLRAWLARKGMPTAIFTANGRTALMVIRLLKDLGRRVPEDVAVVTMDDVAFAPYLEPSLSSIVYPTERACREAVELLMKKLNNRYYTSPGEIRLEAVYVPRRSSGALEP